MNLHRFLFSFALAGSVLGTTSLASADVLPPEVGTCQSTTTEGAVCSRDGEGAGASSILGTCQKSKCTKLDYANWDREAGSGPPSVEYDCFKCVAGPEQAKDAGSTAAPATDGTSGTPASSASDDGGGCSVGGSAQQGAPWLVAIAAAALATTIGRRRKQV